MAYQRRKWTVSGLAVETGIDRRVVADRLSDVEACESKLAKGGRETRYYWGPDAFAAIYAPGPAARAAAPAGEDAGDRLKRLKAEDYELDLAERRGELVRLPAMQSAIDTIGVESSARFDGIGQDVADEVIAAAATGDRAAVVAVIDSAVDRARELFADLRIALRAESGELPAEAPASNGSRVG